MLRKLLACLALLTGLAAAGAPAQAEVANALASRVEASASGSSLAGRTSEAAMARPAQCRVFAKARTTWSVLDSRPAIPSIQLGSDRARE